jgi:predicted permease
VGLVVFSVLTIVAPVFTIIALGFCALRFAYLEAATLAGLSAFVLRVALPALVFHALSRAPISDAVDFRFLAAYGAGSLAMFGSGYVFARWRGGDGAVSSMTGLGMSVSNSGAVGFPIASLVIGPEVAAPFLAQTMIIENLIMLPVGLTLAEMAQSSGGSVRKVLGEIGRTLARNPLLVAIAAGLAVSLSGAGLPEGIARPAALLGTAAVPLALFVVGGRLAQLGRGGGSPLDVAAIVGGKLGGHPLAVGAAIVVLAGADPTLLAPALIFAAVPMMSIYPIFGARFGMAALSATALLVATVAGCATVTGLIVLLQQSGLVDVVA